MIRLAYVSVGSRAIAEEIVHDGFVRLHDRWDTVDNPGGFVRVAVVRLSATWHKRHRMDATASDSSPPPIGCTTPNSTRPGTRWRRSQPTVGSSSRSGSRSGIAPPVDQPSARAWALAQR